MADFGGDDIETFRSEARTWLEANFPEALKTNPAAQMAAAMGGKESPEAKLWRERMGERGWGTPTWPAEYGGRSMHPDFQRIATRIMKKYDAPIMLNAIGNGWAGPLILFALLFVVIFCETGLVVTPFLLGELAYVFILCIASLGLMLLTGVFVVLIG